MLTWNNTTEDIADVLMGFQFAVDDLESKTNVFPLRMRINQFCNIEHIGSWSSLSAALAIVPATGALTYVATKLIINL